MNWSKDITLKNYSIIHWVFNGYKNKERFFVTITILKFKNNIFETSKEILLENLKREDLEQTSLFGGIQKAPSDNKEILKKIIDFIGDDVVFVCNKNTDAFEDLENIFGEKINVESLNIFSHLKAQVTPDTIKKIVNDKVYKSNNKKGKISQENMNKKAFNYVFIICVFIKKIIKNIIKNLNNIECKQINIEIEKEIPRTGKSSQSALENSAKSKPKLKMLNPNRFKDFLHLYAPKNPVSSEYLNKTFELSNYLIVDIETTGFGYEQDELIEIGLVKVENNEIVKQQNWLLKPNKEVPLHIEQITNIKSSDLDDKPQLNQVRDEILDWFKSGKEIVLGHNVLFDLNFLEEKLNTRLTDIGIDTKILASTLLKDLRFKKLEILLELFELGSDSHRAIADCITTKNLFDFLKNYALKNSKKIDRWIMDREKNKDAIKKTIRSILLDKY